MSLGTYMGHGAPYTGIAPVNPFDIECPVDGCDNPAELVCPLPDPRKLILTPAGVLVCCTHYDMIGRILSTRRGEFHLSMHVAGETKIALVPPPPVTRREWNRIRKDLIAILHELHPTTKGH